VVTAGFISRRDLIAGFTTPTFGPKLADATSDQVNALLVGLGDHNADATRLVALGPVRQAWRTVTVDMVDVEGRWLVDTWASTPGPTPALPAEVALDSAETVVGRMGAAVRVGG
jgi:hypothetical protein